MVCSLPAEHTLEQLHITACRDVPAEVLTHIGLDQLVEAFTVVVVQVQGALQIKKLFPGAIFIFITPESFDVLSQRLRSRGTESEEVVEKRLAIAKKEAPNALLYDYIIVNRQGEIKKAAEEIYACVLAENLKPLANRDVIATYFE